MFCLECGKSEISLKRHLKVAHDLAPAEYRAKWDLRTDYPMVAPEYSARRSALAKRLGLGRKPNAKGSPPKAKEARATSNRKT
ncbi:MucR family transcriptional regulator [Aurantimonas sp. A2-1-M11]|uniref:MucR family transcriptional regulator n=1 Tax=Aurantimonas sp. A2-1-M11 TaxID=3113712 RepID=UPI003FA5AA88